MSTGEARMTAGIDLLRWPGIEVIARALEEEFPTP
jgi:hypothetical protein